MLLITFYEVETSIYTKLPNHIMHLTNSLKNFETLINQKEKILTLKFVNRQNLKNHSAITQFQILIIPLKQVPFLIQVKFIINSRMVNHSIESKPHSKSLSSFISGGIAGVISKTVIAPIQRIKYLFITSNRKFSYRLFMADFLHVVNKHGVWNLWRGNLLNVVRIFPHAAIDFAVFDFLRSKFYIGREGQGFGNKLRLFLCGAAAGLTSLTITTPLQFVRVRLAMQKDSFTYHNNLNAFKTIFHTEGLIGFYQGYIAASFGIVIYHGCSFFVFTKLKEKVKQKWPNSYSKWYVDFSIGAISAVGQLVAYPFDIVRKRMQGQKLLYHKKEIQILSNYKRLISDIYNKEGGVIGFYKGISLNMIKAPISLATVWTVKNYLNRMLDKSYDL